MIRERSMRRLRKSLAAVIGAGVLALAGATLASAMFTTTATGGPMPLTTATLAAPAGLAATARCTIGLPTTVAVDLSWTATSSTFADGYEILRSTTGAGGPYVSLGTVSGRTTTTYTDSTVTFSTTYNYVVRAKKNNWRSGNSNVVSATTKNSLCL